MPKIITLTGWSGDTFAHAAGDEIEVDAATAKARVEAGVASWPEGSAEAKAEAKAAASAAASAKKTTERAGATVETAAVEPAPEKR